MEWNSLKKQKKNKSKLENNCTSDEFACINGECIHKLAVCDQVEDCKYGEDESSKLCKCADHEVSFKIIKQLASVMQSL